MDKINKFLLKLSKKERTVLLKIMNDLMNGETKHYNIKALKGFNGLYRLKKGKVRIVYAKQNKQTFMINIAYRKDIYKS